MLIFASLNVFHVTTSNVLEALVAYEILKISQINSELRPSLFNCRSLRPEGSMIGYKTRNKEQKKANLEFQKGGYSMVFLKQQRTFVDYKVNIS